MSEEKDSLTIVKELFKQSEKVLDDQVASTLVATLQGSVSETLSTVKVEKRGVMLKAGSVKTISCKINSLVFDERTPVIFEPEVEELLPSAIQLHSSLLYLKKGSSTRISVSIVNTTARDVLSNGRLPLGELHLVNSDAYGSK